jgi:diguanylate cyclase (GGDEF)-like protein/PAS domain S-box-containing protein
MSSAQPFGICVLGRRERVDLLGIEAEGSSARAGTLAGDAVLTDLVRAAGALARTQADVVVFEPGRVQVVASLGRQVLQPRGLLLSERQLLDNPGRLVAADGTWSLAIGPLPPTAALTLHGELDHQMIDGLHALARLAWARIGERIETAPAGFSDAVIEGLRETVLVVDSDFVIRFASASSATTMGRTPAELLGTNAIDLLHPDDLGVAIDALDRLANGREVYRAVVRLHHGSGEWCRVQVLGRDMTDHPTIRGTVLSLYTDDRDLEVEQDLERHRRLMAAVLDQLHEGVVATDLFGVPTIVNQAARRMYELGPTVMPAAEDLERTTLLDADGIPLVAGSIPFARVRRGETLRSEHLSLFGSDGSLRHVEVSGQPVRNADGEMLGTVVGYRDVTDARRAERELRERSLHDQLTGLPNRRQLHEVLASLADEMRRGSVGVCFVDLDGFKLVNDTLGHRAGDGVLREAAGRLRGCLDPMALLARLGGDEFVALVALDDSETPLLDAAEAMRRALDEPFQVGDTTVTVTASIGVAVIALDDLDEDELLRQADLALYAAKAGGRNRIVVFDEALGNDVELQQRQQEMVRAAIEGNGLVVHFQPLVDVERATIVGFEALARCRRDDGELVGPAGFLDVATQTGLVCDLDRLAFEQSCRAMVLLKAAADGGSLVMNCNVSALSIGRTTFVDDILATIASHGLATSDICIEITESTAFDAGPAAIETLRRLSDAGVGLALDDFGTGYSSLAHLRDLPLASVKVDRSFISRLEEHGSERAITDAIVRLAATLRLDVVAEGVETLSQLEHVRLLGFPVVQGFHYAPPCALDTALELLTDGF